MKKLLGSLIAFIALFHHQSAHAQYSARNAEAMGWRLSAQAWTFKNFTFIEALDRMKEASIMNIEMYPGQKLGGGLEGTTDFTMKEDVRTRLLAVIKAKGMKLVNYGVASAGSPAEWTALMEFAAAMGIETIVAEPDSAQLDYIEPLCERFHINVALHNHPNPAIYWNPDFAMQQIARRNRHIGICADFGHWYRSGLDPVASLKKCAGRVLSVHAKDLVPGEGGFVRYHDVPWGTGLCNFSGLIHELRRQEYKGTLSVEYEYHWDTSVPEIKESVDYFNRLSYWIGKEAPVH